MATNLHYLQFKIRNKETKKAKQVYHNVERLDQQSKVREKEIIFFSFSSKRRF